MRLLAVLAIVVYLVTAALATDTVTTDLEFTRLETEISFWGRGDYVPTERTRERMDSQITRFANDHPRLADAHRLRASQLVWEAYWASDVANRKTLAE